MAGTSSLLKSAASRRAAIQNEKNRIADMEWNLSAQTADDLKLYQDHYTTAAKSASSSDKISYTNKITSATRSFRSNEIQRATIGVLEGTMDNYSKQNMMIGLYNSAVDNGDYNAAQNIRNQIDTLQNTIIAEQTANMNTAQKMLEAGYSDTKAYVSALQSGTAKIMGGYSLNDINNLYKEYGGAGITPFIKQFSQESGVPITSYTDIANLYATQMIGDMKTAANSLVGVDQANVLNDITDYELGNKKIKIPGIDGANDGVTLSELSRAVEAQTNGTSPIQPAYVNGTPAFKRSEIMSWAVTTDANGVSKPTPVYRMAQMGEKTSPKDMASNMATTNVSGFTEIQLTDPNGNKNVGKLYSKPDGTIVDETGKVKFKPEDVSKLTANGTTINTVNKTAQQALADRGFTVYENGTAELPMGAQVPKELQGLPASDYQVDKNGLIQFSFENKTGDPKNPVQRSVLVYDPRTNLYTSTLEKGNYTINNKTYNKMGELIGTGSKVQTKPGDYGYATDYAKQRQSVPGLPADPYKGSYTINGVTYNAAGDVLNGASNPALPTASTPVLKLAQQSIAPKPAALPAPFVAPKPKPVPLAPSVAPRYNLPGTISNNVSF